MKYLLTLHGAAFPCLVASKEVAEEKLLSRKQQIGESAEEYVYSMKFKSDTLFGDFDQLI